MMRGDGFDLVYDVGWDAAAVASVMLAGLAMFGLGFLVGRRR